MKNISQKQSRLAVKDVERVFLTPEHVAVCPYSSRRAVSQQPCELDMA